MFKLFLNDPFEVTMVPLSEQLHLTDCQAATDVGCVRSHNEDCILIASGCRWLIVADGMGGYEGGEVAARLAVETAHQTLKTSVAQGGHSAGGQAGVGHGDKRGECSRRCSCECSTGTLEHGQHFAHRNHS